MLILSSLLSVALSAEPPTVDLQGFVLRPEIHYAESSKARAGGLAFVVEDGDARLALLPYQLFGAPSGMPSIPAAKMATSVRKVALSEASTGAWLVNTGAPLKTTMEPVGESAARDLVILPLDAPADALSTLTTGRRAAPRPGALAAQSPAKGDPVWLVAPVSGSEGALHRATVAEINGDFLFYDLADASLTLAGTAGAPVVNAEGKVVGMQVGVIRFEDGVLAGSAVPLNAIRQRLTEAAAAK